MTTPGNIRPIRDWEAVDRSILQALEEDIGTGDITTECTVGKGLAGTGQISAKKPCVVAGLFLVQRVFSLLDQGVQVKIRIPEGKRVASDTVLCTLSGPVDVLLRGERTVLNFVQRTCGIATLTTRFVRAVRQTNARIYDTRKTVPGLRTLDKYAVRAGGGVNHRMGLYDALLLKENHIATTGGVVRAIQRARKAAPDLPVEIEARTIEEVVLAVEYGADIVLLDNMLPGGVSKAASLVGDRVQLEVSGGITLKNVKQMAQTGVSRISVGALTHSAPAADLSMLIVSKRRR